MNLKEIYRLYFFTLFEHQLKKQLPVAESFLRSWWSLSKLTNYYLWRRNSRLQLPSF